MKLSAKIDGPDLVIELDSDDHAWGADVIRIPCKDIVAAASHVAADIYSPNQTQASSICGCCGERPIAHPEEQECLDCYTANTSEGF